MSDKTRYRLAWGTGVLAPVAVAALLLSTCDEGPAKWGAFGFSCGCSFTAAAWLLIVQRDS